MAKIPPNERDKMPPVWDMSQERALTEQVLGQQFHFFLIFFSLVIAGAINVRTQLHLQIILILGTAIGAVLAAAISRTARRLDRILDELRTDDTHPFTIISKGVGGVGVRFWLWEGIPPFCCVCLVAGAVLAWFNILTVAPRIGG